MCSDYCTVSFYWIRYMYTGNSCEYDAQNSAAKQVKIKMAQCSSSVQVLPFSLRFSQWYFTCTYCIPNGTSMIHHLTKHTVQMLEPVVPTRSLGPCDDVPWTRPLFFLVLSNFLCKLLFGVEIVFTNSAQSIFLLLITVSVGLIRCQYRLCKAT
jgi:hypothetical protein